MKRPVAEGNAASPMKAPKTADRKSNRQPFQMKQLKTGCEGERLQSCYRAVGERGSSHSRLDRVALQGGTTAKSSNNEPRVRKRILREERDGLG
jgi:hypothetical protein